MADVKWIKVYTDMFATSRKIKQIEHMPEGDTILIIWLKLMLLAGSINDGGRIYITPKVPYTTESLANELKRPLTTVKLALSIFETYDMIEVVDDVIKLSSWEEYQNIEGMEKIREQNRIRKQRQRAKALLPEANNDTSRDCHVTVTQGHATEKEEELEEDKEKEYHSFILAEKTPEKTVDKESAQRRFLQGSLGKGVVMLSDEQISSLLDQLTVEEFDHYVAVVADCELKGQRFKKKTHYQAILDMAKHDRKLG